MCGGYDLSHGRAFSVWAVPTAAHASIYSLDNCNCCCFSLAFLVAFFVVLGLCSRRAHHARLARQLCWLPVRQRAGFDEFWSAWRWLLSPRCLATPRRLRLIVRGVAAWRIPGARRSGRGQSFVALGGPCLSGSMSTRIRTYTLLEFR